MFSFEDGKPIALVTSGELSGAVLFVEDKPNTHVCCRKCGPHCAYRPCCRNCCFEPSSITLRQGEFEHIPSFEDRVIYIAGPSGSGKTTYAGKYIDKYLKLNKKAKFFVFSLLEHDEGIDYLKPHRVKITEDLVENPIDIQREIAANAIILFDDIDNIQEKKLQMAVNKIKGQILEIGRHKNIRIVVTSHLINPNERAAARTLLNEMNTLTVFPSAGSSYQIEYTLKRYLGFSPNQIKEILKTKSRWVTIFKSYPQIVLSVNQAVLVSDFK
jgi:hypothetical protein